jgi:hypothetical protein
MTTTLASLTSPMGQEVATWLGCLAFLVVLVNGILKLADRIKDKPPVSDVRAELVEKFVSKDVFNAQVAANMQEHRDLFAKLGGIERGSVARMDTLNREWQERLERHLSEMQRTDRESRDKMHERINAVLQAVSRVEGELKSLRAE